MDLHLNQPLKLELRIVVTVWYTEAIIIYIFPKEPNQNG